jgi:hypothetical protein
MTVAPELTAVLGADDTHNEFVMLYSDQRSVVRRFEMTLTANRWTMLRRAPGFHQRFIGRIAPNGRCIKATWENQRMGGDG